MASMTPLPGTGEMQESDTPRTDGVFNNTPDLRRLVVQAMDDIDHYDAERAEIAARRREIRDRLKAFGVDLKAFDVALKRRRLEAEDADKAGAFDESLRMCLQATGVQADLFSPDDIVEFAARRLRETGGQFATATTGPAEH